MKAWIVGVATIVLVLAAGAGLALTWDSTQTSATGTFGPSIELSDGALVTTASTSTTTSTRAPLQSPTTTLAPLPPCEYLDEPVTQDPATEWDTIVIDTAMRLPADYAPADLVPVSDAGFGSSDDTVREFVIPDLSGLRAAAEAAGTPLAVVSGYRSYAYQENLFAHRVAALGLEATAHTGRAGHSEHQLGTTIDVLDPPSTELTEAFGTTPAGQWIAAHAHEFGFVQSYPAGVREKTCYDYEPWHFRYVGRDVSAQIHASGMPPREWLLTHRPDG
ncbi:MAG TPA: M15 family metallopeptidase [Acidimicrobiales bacterium]|nr:M15 family metallopeptidase [Acidimicrobiales bacterium]